MDHQLRWGSGQAHAIKQISHRLLPTRRFRDKGGLSPGNSPSVSRNCSLRHEQGGPMCTCVFLCFTHCLPQHSYPSWSSCLLSVGRTG